MARTTLMNKSELGISENAFNKIKEIKINIKKDLIKSAAEVDLLAVDIKTKLWEASDINEISKLIDKKYEIKKESMKKLVSAMLHFKKAVTEDQLMKLHSMIRPEISAQQ